MWERVLETPGILGAVRSAQEILSPRDLWNSCGILEKNQSHLTNQVTSDT